MSQNEPKLKAAFLLDKSGRPAESRHGHYKIRLFIDEAPAETYAVTYKLDPSYYDPVREAINRSDGFSEEITSYGNYVITAKVRTRSHPVELRRSLYDALVDYYGGWNNPTVRSALENIKEN